jgi:spermidine synthase
MAPTSLLSGILFTLIGRRLREEVGEDSAAAGWLTLANTLGAAVGALAGGFVLLPLLGMENSIGALGAGYALPALLLWRARGETTAAYRRATLAAAALGLGALATFPSGLMERAYRARILRYWHAPGIEVAAWKETTMATLLYTRSQLFSETLSHALLTNGYSMAGTKVASRRYMKQYVYWPVALHAAPRRALLICFGLGSTAAALTDTRELTSIDVVDVSPEVLKMGRLAARPGRPYPLDDPRVRVHVEDGRFFLLTREERYDIITSEPPPPRTPGVVSLYTTEYFRLVRSRLAPGGIATYWLPVHDMSRDEAASILKAFCDAFDDCSVWNGDTFNLMLAGSSGAAYTPSPARLERQWRDPELTAELHAVGFDTPAALFATYIGDAPYVAEWTRGVRPLEDDFPHRLAPRPAPPDSGNDHLAFMDADAAAERFRASAWPRRLGGGALVEETLRLFPLVQILNRRAISGDPQVYADRARALLESPSPWLSLTVFASDPDQVAIAERAAARRVQDENLSYIRALGEAARHRYEEAEHLMQDALARQPHTPHLAEFRVLLLCLQGRTRDAWTAIDAWAAARKPPLDPPFQSWAARECPRPRH